MFKFQPLERLRDMLLVSTDAVYRDHRGSFFESYREKDFEKAGIRKFVQGNISKSAPWTLRGMHYQFKRPQGKFIRVLTGAIFDAAVDLRRSSPTFGQWDGMYLDSDNCQGLYIPPGFAHGFIAMAQGATVLYETTTYHDPQSDRSLYWNDPTAAIPWPIGQNTPMILSSKDRAARRLSDIPQEDLFA